MRRAAAALVAAALGLALTAAAAGAELDEPVSVTAEAPSAVAAGSAFQLSVAVAAEAGALDVAVQPLRAQIRAEPECAGSFAGGEGPVLADRALPAPAAGAAYSAELSLRARLDQQGETTLCAYLDDAEERQFATDTEAAVAVVAPCTVSRRQVGKLRRRVRRVGRRVHGLDRRIRRAHRHHAPKQRLRGLQRKRRQLQHRRRVLQRRLRRARQQIAIACPGVAAGRARASASAAGPPAPPQIKHLFVILLENENAEKTFGDPPPAPYLGTKMLERGAFIPNYYGIGHQSLDNYIALVSGQPPNLATQSDCLVYSEMAAVATNEEGIALGQGCVYPRSVRTVANQLENHGLSWRGYMQDMAASVSEGEPGSCRHPTLGGPDTTQVAGPTDQYAARHNPFVYFHSIIDYETCQRNDVDLEQLPADLEREATTPSYSFITPDLCADGHDSSCADISSPGGFEGINAFLERWVPLIEASPAYRDHGAIFVSFDESESGALSCCNEPTGPNTLNNGGPTFGDGGGRVGAVMVSPCIAPGTVSDRSYNHYSLLRWTEDNFGLSHLGYAGAEGLEGLGGDVLNRPECPTGSHSRAEAKAETRTALRIRPRRAVAGRARRFRLRVIADLDECRVGALVRFAGHRARTNARGIAWIRAKPGRPGKRGAIVRPAGCRPARAQVRVVRPHQRAKRSHRRHRR